MVNPFEITWEAPEFEHRPKDGAWYWGSILFTIAVLGIAVWQKNFLFAVFAVIAEILVLVWGNKQPRLMRFMLNEKGFEIAGKKSHPYGDIQSFSMEDAGEDGRFSELTLRFHHALKPPLRAQVPRDLSEKVQKILHAFITETDPERSLIDELEKFVRF